MNELSAADWALKQVEAVREDPAKRLELLERTYHGPSGRAPHHLPFRRAAMAFMRWQLARGVLAPPHATPPGSPWWRAANERLLRDGCEAVARSGGRGAAAADRPRCPDCGARLVAVGREARRLTAAHARPITLERTRGRCPACGVGVFPPR